MMVTSCQYFQSVENPDVVVSLDGRYITTSDLQALLPVDYTTEDSTTIVDRYIRDWLLDVSLMENALDNIPDQRQEQLDQLVDRYKIELYTQEYLQELTKQNLDTAISARNINRYYTEKNEEFILNEDLVKFRYVMVDPLYEEFDEVEKWFKKGDSVSLHKVDSLKLTYKGFFLNDSIWVKKSKIFENIPLIDPANESNYLIAGKNWKEEDSLGLYLIHFNDILKRGEVAPQQYVEPTIKQILLNRRKLEFIKNLEQDLLEDAVLRKK
jgi:hypothetical protein